jgi:adenylate kinase family enzyme
MQRVSLVGVSGAGKTTVGRKMAASLGVPFVELDAIFHQPYWVELPRDDFRERVGAALAAPGWVVDGNYSAVSPPPVADRSRQVGASPDNIANV